MFFRTYSRPSVFIPCAIFCFALLWPTGARGEGFQPVNPDELKMTSEPLAPGAPAIILYRQVDREDTNTHIIGNSFLGSNGTVGAGRQYTSRDVERGQEIDYYRIKILTKTGLKYAEAHIPYQKGSGIDLVDVHARTIHADGTIINFEGKIADGEIHTTRGVVFEKSFTLPDVQVGSVLEYYYTLGLGSTRWFEHGEAWFKNAPGSTAGRFGGSSWGVAFSLYDSHWILNQELFTKKARFSLRPYKCEDIACGDTGLHVRWSWNYLPQGAGAPKQGTDKVIRMEVENVPAFQAEDYMPPENEMRSRVDFIYSNDYETDPNKFWRSHGKTFYNDVEKFMGREKSMQEAVSQIVSASDSPEAKLQKIYARVQQLRNVSYESWRTADEKKSASEKPNANVEDVWKSGYGNSEQLDWLFLALTRAAGLEAYPAFASSRERYFFKPANMDISALDTRLVLVKVNGKDVFCDPGEAFVPFGVLPWYETGVQALRLDKEGGSWFAIPTPRSGMSRIVRKADLALSENGSLEGELTVTFTGLEAIKRREQEAQDDDTARKKYLVDDVKSWISSPAAQLELFNQPDWKSSEPLVAEFKITIPGALSSAGKLSLLPASLFGATEKGIFAPQERVYQIYFEYPFQKEDDIAISLPGGWQLAGLPKEQNVDLKVALYSLQAKNENGAIHLHREFNSDLFVVPQQSYLPLRNFYQFVNASDEERIALLPGTAAASK